SYGDNGTRTAKNRKRRPFEAGKQFRQRRRTESSSICWRLTSGEGLCSTASLNRNLGRAGLDHNDLPGVHQRFDCSARVSFGLAASCPPPNSLSQHPCTVRQ